MRIARKLLKKNTFFIKNGNHLEEIKQLLFGKYSEQPLWGYDNTYEDDDEVSSGYLHWDKGFYLSKLSFDKPTLKEI